jgi:hypothetical protein
MITHLAHVPIFNRSVFFVGGCPAEEAENAIYRLKGKRTKVSLSYRADGCVRDCGGDVFVWVKDLDRASVVAHEVAHAACSIMEVCGIPQCRETDEVMCYLIGWLKINVQDKVYDKLEKAQVPESAAHTVLHGKGRSKAAKVAAGSALTQRVRE